MFHHCEGMKAPFSPPSSRAKRAKRSKSPGRSEALWAAQHEAAAGRIFDVLCDLKGFYLKLGQILASKTDMMPLPYTESLKRLLDKMPPVPFKQVWGEEPAGCNNQWRSFSVNASQPGSQPLHCLSPPACGGRIPGCKRHLQDLYQHHQCRAASSRSRRP